MTREYPSLDGVREVVMIEPVFQAFLEMAEARGWRLFQIPMSEPDEIPAYGIDPFGGKR